MSVRIIVSEIALEALLIYHGRDQEHSRRVTSALQGLAEDGRDRQVLRLSGSPRPIWTESLDENTVIYFTFGHGAGTLELRIALIGPPPADSRFDLGRVLHAAGDVPYHEIPDVIRLDERQTTAAGRSSLTGYSMRMLPCRITWRHPMTPFSRPFPTRRRTPMTCMAVVTGSSPGSDRLRSFPSA